MKPTSPVVKGLEQFEIEFGKNQPEYIPLPALVGGTMEHPVIARWQLTDEERKLIAEGCDIYIMQSTFGSLFHPMHAAVASVTQDAQEFMSYWNVGGLIAEEKLNEVLDGLLE